MAVPFLLLWVNRHVGQTVGRRIKRSELDRRLTEQRDNTFSRRWFEAWRSQEALERKAEEAKGKRRKALKAAAEAAAESLHAIEAKRGEVEAATLEAEALSLKNTIDAALSAQTMAATINRALEVVRVASEQAEIEDEEEAIMLLLQ